VRTTYLVGSVALALICSTGGLRTRFQSIRAVLVPSMVLATIGVLLTALITAPIARYALDLNWIEALLVGAWWPRPMRGGVPAGACTRLAAASALGATLEVESGTNDPFAVFLIADAGRTDFPRRKLAAACRAGFGREAVLAVSSA